jgi:ATP-dependent Lhr-like helicase
VETQKASPFAQSLLFAWIAVYMYEGDQPLGERRAAALALDRDLLRDLLGSEDLRDLIDPRALADLELELQALADGRRARNPDDAHDLLRRLGDLSPAELDMRSDGNAHRWIDDLVAEHRVLPVRIAGDERLIAVEDAGRVRDALGVTIPPGVPSVFAEPVDRPLVSIVARFARTRGPFLPDDAARRFGVPVERIDSALRELETEERVARGEFRPAGSNREWCDVQVLRSMRRRSLAALRREIEPVEGDALARFELEWQAISRPRQGPSALADAVEQLQGAAIPASILETDVLPARVAGYRGAELDALCAAGDVVWTGAGGIGADDGRVALVFRGALPALAPVPPDDRPARPVHDAIREQLASRGASFWPDLVRAAGTAEERVVLAALWDLVWAGEITNDTLAPLRAVLGRRPRTRASGRPRPGALRRLGPPAGQGRWSLVAPLLDPAPSPTQTAHARAMQLLDRYGVVTRETVLAEGSPGGFAGVYGVLKALEESGKVRRGYFVSGLGAAQFAVPGAVDRLREHREATADARAVALPAADPAQPYGATLPWPDAGGRPSRAAGAYVVCLDGRPVAFLERGARTLFTFEGRPADAMWADALVGLVKDGRLRRIELARIDGGPASSSSLAEGLRERGFVEGYRGLTFRG